MTTHGLTAGVQAGVSHRGLDTSRPPLSLRQSVTSGLLWSAGLNLLGFITVSYHAGIGPAPKPSQPTASLGS